MFDICKTRNIPICCLPALQAEAVILLCLAMRETKIYVSFGVCLHSYVTESWPQANSSRTC